MLSVEGMINIVQSFALISGMYHQSGGLTDHSGPACVLECQR